MRQVEFDFKEDTVEISVYDLQNDFPELFEKRVYRGENLETVERLQYVDGQTPILKPRIGINCSFPFIRPQRPSLRRMVLDAQTIEKEFDGLGRLYKAQSS